MPVVVPIVPVIADGEVVVIVVDIVDVDIVVVALVVAVAVAGFYLPTQDHYQLLRGAPAQCICGGLRAKTTTTVAAGSGERILCTLVPPPSVSEVLGQTGIKHNLR